MPTRSISNRMTARPEVSYLGSLRAVVLCVVLFFISLISPVLLFSVFYFYFSRCHQRYHSSTQVSVANRKCPSRQVKTIMQSSQDSLTVEDSDTQSLTASVTDYPIEHGRRYHRYHEGAYIYPNDEQELDRLDMQHHMFKLLNEGRLFFSPLQNPRRILDIGTGSGIWPMEMASIFPQTEIIGTDLSPVQPTEVPENVHFLVDDCTEDDWLWDHDHFDLIHISHLTGSLPSYKALLRKAMRHLKPGSYIECHELDPKPKCDDGTMPPENPDTFCDYALIDWFDLNVRSGQAADPPRQFRVAHRMARWMTDLGFVDVQTRIFKLPTNPWPSDPHLKTIGSWSETNWLEALSGWSYKPLMGLSWSKPEIEVFLVDVRKSIQDRNVHSYTDFYVVTGRKPYPGEQTSSS